MFGAATGRALFSQQRRSMRHKAHTSENAIVRGALRKGQQLAMCLIGSGPTVLCAFDVELRCELQFEPKKRELNK